MLSKRVKYAIKTLLFLNRTNNASLFSAKKISENERIPLKFLEQILRELKQNKILKSERGAEGGYTFMKDPADIKVLDVIRIVDGPVAMLPCASLNFYEKCGYQKTHIKPEQEGMDMVYMTKKIGRK